MPVRGPRRRPGGPVAAAVAVALLLGATARGEESRPDSVCGADDRRPAACYPDDLRIPSRAVARVSVGGEECSGFRLDCPGDLLLTNAHCVPDAGAALAATVVFLDETDCAGLPVGLPLSVPVVRLVHVDPGLDAALLELDGAGLGLASLVGGLRLADHAPAGGEEIFLPQHPGRPTQVAAIDDDGAPCRLDPLAGDLEIAYRCDTSPGSSGAPVIARDDGKVVGLHFAGNAGRSCDDGGRNRAIRGDRLARWLEDASGCSHACPPPAAPSAVSLVSSCGLVRIAWTPVDDATAYRVWRSGSGCLGPWSVVAEQEAAGTVWEGEPGTTGGRTGWAVTSVSACGASSPRSLCVGQVESPDPTPLPPPVATAVRECGEVSLSWVPAEGAMLHAVERSGEGCEGEEGGWETLGVTSGSSWLDTAPPSSRGLAYRIRPVGDCGPSPAAACIRPRLDRCDAFEEREPIPDGDRPADDVR